jgi:hypothetical protein
VRLLFPLAAVVLVAVPGALSQSAVNLLQNPGAEGAAGATNSTAIAVTPGWTPAGPFTAVAYGTPGFPVSGSGRNFFAGGPGASRSSGTQVVDVSASSATIDAGRMQATLSALVGGFETQEDSATVEATFLDHAGASLSSDELRIGPVDAAQRGGQTKLLPKSATVDVPPRTRKIEVVISAERASGAYNDGYVDDVSLTLRASSRPAPPVAKTYLWGATAVAFGEAGSTLTSETISATGSARTQGTHVLSARGDVRVVFSYRKPKGKKRVLLLRPTVVAKLAPRVGGGGSITVNLRIVHSDFGNCHKDGRGTISLIDGAGIKADSLILSACGTRTRYVNGGPHRLRVRVTIGERR